MSTERIDRRDPDSLSLLTRIARKDGLNNPARVDPGLIQQVINPQIEAILAINAKDLAALLPLYNEKGNIGNTQAYLMTIGFEMRSRFLGEPSEEGQNTHPHMVITVERESKVGTEPVSYAQAFELSCRSCREENGQLRASSVLRRWFDNKGRIIDHREAIQLGQEDPETKRKKGMALILSPSRLKTRYVLIDSQDLRTVVNGEENGVKEGKEEPN